MYCERVKYRVNDLILATQMLENFTKIKLGGI